MLDGGHDGPSDVPIYRLTSAESVSANYDLISDVLFSKPRRDGTAQAESHRSIESPRIPITMVRRFGRGTGRWVARGGTWGTDSWGRKPPA